MVGKTGPIVLLPAWERSYDLRIAIVQAKFDLGIAAARGWRLGRDRRWRRWAGGGPSPTGTSVYFRTPAGEGHIRARKCGGPRQCNTVQLAVRPKLGTSPSATFPPSDSTVDSAPVSGYGAWFGRNHHGLAKAA